MSRNYRESDLEAIEDQRGGVMGMSQMNSFSKFNRSGTGMNQAQKQRDRALKDSRQAKNRQIHAVSEQFSSPEGDEGSILDE